MAKKKVTINTTPVESPATSVDGIHHLREAYYGLVHDVEEFLRLIRTADIDELNPEGMFTLARAVQVLHSLKGAMKVYDR